MLWMFIRSCFLWMPYPLFCVCSMAFVGFGLLFFLRLIKFLLEYIPGY